VKESDFYCTIIFVHIIGLGLVKNTFFGVASLMLRNWTSHVDYQHFISQAVSSLNLDPLADFLFPYYSPFGRPAIHQPEIFRSVILMID
jgi:hypothetical protein